MEAEDLEAEGRERETGRGGEGKGVRRERWNEREKRNTRISLS